MDDATGKALTEYQKRNSLKVTGLLDYPTQKKLETDYETVQKSIPSTSTLHVFTELWDSDGYASARGTWIGTNTELANPVQSTQITCYREIMRCSEASAQITSFASSESFLSVDLESWEIERWDEHEIVTKPNEYICARAIRRFNRSQKQVTGLRSTINTKDFCAGMSSNELHMVLADGIKRTVELTTELNKQKRAIMLIPPGVIEPE